MDNKRTKTDLKAAPHHRSGSFLSVTFLYSVLISLYGFRRKEVYIFCRYYQQFNSTSDYFIAQCMGQGLNFLTEKTKDNLKEQSLNNKIACFTASGQS